MRVDGSLLPQPARVERFEQVHQVQIGERGFARNHELMRRDRPWLLWLHESKPCCRVDIWTMAVVGVGAFNPLIEILFRLEVELGEFLHGRMRSMDVGQKLIVQATAELIQAQYDLVDARVRLKSIEREVAERTQAVDLLLHRLAVLQGDADADEAP